MRGAWIVLGGLLVCGFLIRQTGQKESGHGFVCTLANAQVSESSGVACSNRSRGAYWTHNDSGDGPNFFAFDSKGADLGTFSLFEVKAVDWEDMASARVKERPYLYFGDIGDNSRKRSDIRIYRVPEPKPDGKSHTLVGFDTYICKYPDGPHDCETLMVEPSGAMQLVTKSRDGISGVYRLPAPKKSGTFVLTKLGTVRFEGDPFRMLATGGDISPDGKKVVVRTYFSALVFSARNLSTWFQDRPTTIELAAERQGEAICFDLPNRRFITTSEGKPCVVSFARIP